MSPLKNTNAELAKFQLSNHISPEVIKSEFEMVIAAFSTDLANFGKGIGESAMSEVQNPDLVIDASDAVGIRAEYIKQFNAKKELIVLLLSKEYHQLNEKLKVLTSIPKNS